MMGGFFNEVVKAIAARGESHFHSRAGIGSDVIRAMQGKLGEKKETEQFGAGGEAVKVKLPSPQQGNPVPILKQILLLLKTIGMKLGVVQRNAPGTPPPLPIGTQLRNISGNIRERVKNFQFRRVPAEERSGHFQMRQIGMELARKRGIEFKEAPKVEAGGAGGTGAGAAGLLRSLSVVMRVVGVAGLVISALGLVASALKNFVMGVEEENTRLAKFNASIAGSVSQLQVTKMKLDVAQGASTAGGATELNKQLENLMIEFQPFRQQLGQIANIAAISAVLLGRIAVKVVKMETILSMFISIPKVAEGILKAVDEANKDKNANNQLPLNILKDLKNVGNNRAAILQPGAKKPQFLDPIPRRQRR